MTWLVHSISKEPSTKGGLLLNGKELKPKEQAKFVRLQYAKTLKTFELSSTPALHKNKHNASEHQTPFQEMGVVDFDELKTQLRVEYKASLSEVDHHLEPPFPTIRALTIRESITQWEARRILKPTSKKFGASFFVAICLDLRASIENASNDWQLPKSQHINPRWVESFMGLPSGWCNPQHKKQH